MMVIVLVRVSIAGKGPVTLPTLIKKTLTEVAAYSFRGLLRYHYEWEHGAGEGTAIY